MGLRYGLLAALTLVLACALLWDRLHPPRTEALFPRDLPESGDTARVVVGGPPAPPPPASAPVVPPAAPPAAVPAPPKAASPAPPSPAKASSPPKKASPPPAESPRSHRVAGGETLYGLARKYYGNGGRWTAIAEANGLSEGDTLRVGQTLRIPAGP